MSLSVIRTRIYSSNDELISALVKRGIIQIEDIEKVLRSVDRRLYFTNDEKHNAYLDFAWKSDKINLSAPCVYATALACLDLRPGYKFLNIGSGIGYLSTVAGLLLGINGVNHGIEIHKSSIDYALKKMEEFKLNSAAIDYFDFCEPVFIQGNAYELMPVGYYDRVYCGADASPAQYEFLKSLIKVGGILAIKFNGVVVRVIREKESVWLIHSEIKGWDRNPVVPGKYSFNTLKFPPLKPLSLQELCRSKVRSVLRENLKKEFPNLPMRTLCSNNVLEIKNICRPPNRALSNVCNISELFGYRYDDVLNMESDEDSEEDNNVGNEDSDRNDEDNDIDNNSTKKCETTNPNRGNLFEGIERLENQNQQNKNTEQTPYESTKRKSPEAGSSMENNISIGTETGAENPKRMKMNKSPRKSESGTSTSFHSKHDSCDTVSTGTSSYQRTRRLKMVSFINERKENDLSKYLKDKIDSLPIPTPLKDFLNYNSVN